MLTVGVVATLATVGVVDPASAATATTRVSSSSSGAPGNADSMFPQITPDGRYVTFQSGADNLVPGDINGHNDVFVRDRRTGWTELISVPAGGGPANLESGEGQPSAITPDGRYVAFSSSANLTPDDRDLVTDIFLRDRVAKTTVKVDVLASPGINQGGFAPRITANGRYVMFTSRSATLVAGDTNGRNDVFVRDMKTGVTRRVSVKAGGSQVAEDTRGYDISADGRYVLFESLARYTPGDTNNSLDGFVKDLVTGAVERVSVTGSGNGKQVAGGTEGMSMTPDGRYVVFNALPAHLNIQVYVRDRATRRSTLVSVNTSGKPGRTASLASGISPNGRYVVFGSGSPDLVPGAPFFFNTFVRDLKLKATTLVSRTSAGTPVNESSDPGALSDNAVTFSAYATGVVPDGGDVRRSQVYLHPL
jgi:Tol biopolymer transport system component